MASAAKKKAAEPVRPIIVKKIIDGGHGGHHGGAWKVAYADFVTAMMAFFLLMWILGATTDKQRKGIADYFSPNLIDTKTHSGANGLLGGDSVQSPEKYAHQHPKKPSTLDTPPENALEAKARLRAADRERFKKVRQQLIDKMKSDKKLSKLLRNVRFTDTREGLRIDLVDESDFAMFSRSTETLLPQARDLMAQVAQVIASVPNDVIVRGHTDALPYTAGRAVNNWTLSSARAEATRKALADSGVGGKRFARIEGVAEREPYIPDNIYDPRNRRMSVTLAWTGGDDAPTVVDSTPAHADDAAADKAGPPAH
jgi:chemotaxis protein MotB